MREPVQPSLWQFAQRAVLDAAGAEWAKARLNMPRLIRCAERAFTAETRDTVRGSSTQAICLFGGWRKRVAARVRIMERRGVGDNRDRVY